MDFCCDDDFTESNSFLTDDVDIYLAYQAYLVGSGGVHPQLSEFKEYYNNLVSSGIAQELANEIKKLPASECADYTETGSISTDDSNIYSAFQAYLISTGGINPSDVHTFDEYFQNSLVNTGLVNPLNSSIKHLPSLATDDFVIADTGNINKNCPTPTPTPIMYEDWDTNHLNKIVHFDFSNPSGYTTSGNSITSLTDLTGNFSMTSGHGGGTLQTTSNQLNQKNTAYFNGSENYVSSNESQFTDSSGNHYAIGVFKVTGVDDTKDSVWSFESNDNEAKREYAISAGSTSNWFGEIDLDSLNSNRISDTPKIDWKTNTSIGTSTYKNNWHIFAVVFNKTKNQIYMRVDGRLATDIHPYINKMSNTVDMRFMRNRTSKVVQCYVAEFFGVASNSDNMEDGTTEIEKAEGFLAHKWGLVNFLPPDHVYMAYSPRIYKTPTPTPTRTPSPTPTPTQTPTPTPTPSPTPSPTPIKCVSTPVTITVSSEFDESTSTSTFKYTTSDSSGAGGLFGCIDVERGSTLTIFVDGDEPNLISHPLTITNFNDQGQAMAPVDGVVKTDLTSGPTEDHTYSLTWVVPCDETIDKYQYQCEEHAHMRGTINVFGECPTPTPTPTQTPIDCLPDISTGNNKSYLSDAPVTHIGGGTFEWCGGTQYTDPGLLLLKDLCDETELTLENGGVEVLYFDSSGQIPITNLIEIEKLGLLVSIELDNGTTIGPNSYTFKVKYKLSYNNQSKIGGGRSITVKDCSTPTPTPTPTFFEEEPINEYIYDSMEAVSITGGADGDSVVGYNDRSLTTIQGVNGVTGLSIANNIVTLTESGRYYIKARSDAYMSEYIFTSIKFLSGDYADQNFDGPTRWTSATSGDMVVSENSVVVDITQTTTFKIQTNVTKAKALYGLNHGGASLFVQKLASADGNSSSGGSASSLQVIKDKSNFYTDLPDAIVWPHSPASIEAADRSEAILHLKFVHEPHPTDGVANDIFYECRDVNQGGVYLGFAFNNNSNGDYATLYSSHANFQDIPSATNSLKWFVENNRAIYYGGSSSSGGHPKLQEASDFDGIIPDRIIVNNNQSSPSTFRLYGIQPNVGNTINKIVYRDNYGNHDSLFFQNDATGTSPSFSNSNWSFFETTNSLKDVIDTGYAIFDANGSTSANSSYVSPSSGSSSTFASLTDTPSELSAGKYIKVNDAGDGIEFVDAPSGGFSMSNGSPTTNAKMKEYIDNFSTLGFDLPDMLIVKDHTGRMSVRYLNFVSDTGTTWNFLYRTLYTSSSNDYYISFKNEVDGPVGGSDNTHSDFSDKNLKWYIDNGYAVYSGGSSSSGGISAWGVFDGTANYDADNYLPIKASENIESIKYISTGVYEVTMTNPMPNEHYSVSVDCNPSGYSGAYGGVMDLWNNQIDNVATKSKFRIDVRTYGNAQTNSNRITFHVVSSVSGSSSASMGDLDIIKNNNSFYTKLPDAIVADITDSYAGTRILYLTTFGDGLNISYHSNDATTNYYMYFNKDDINGAVVGSGSNVRSTSPYDTLKGYIDNNRAIYF